MFAPPSSRLLEPHALAMKPVALLPVMKPMEAFENVTGPVWESTCTAFVTRIGAPAKSPLVKPTTVPLLWSRNRP